MIGVGSQSSVSDGSHALRGNRAVDAPASELAGCPASDAPCRSDHAVNQNDVRIRLCCSLIGGCGWLPMVMRCISSWVNGGMKSRSGS